MTQDQSQHKTISLHRSRKAELRDNRLKLRTALHTPPDACPHPLTSLLHSVTLRCSRSVTNNSRKSNRSSAMQHSERNAHPSRQEALQDSAVPTRAPWPQARQRTWHDEQIWRSSE